MRTPATCAHCRSPYQRDPDDDGPDAYLCPDCADAAVLGEPCAVCRRIPGRRPCQPDPERYCHGRPDPQEYQTT